MRTTESFVTPVPLPPARQAGSDVRENEVAGKWIALPLVFPLWNRLSPKELASWKGDPQNKTWFQGVRADFGPHLWAVTGNWCRFGSGHQAVSCLPRAGALASNSASKPFTFGSRVI